MYGGATSQINVGCSLKMAAVISANRYQPAVDASKWKMLPVHGNASQSQIIIKMAPQSGIEFCVLLSDPSMIGRSLGRMGRCGGPFRNTSRIQHHIV